MPCGRATGRQKETPGTGPQALPQAPAQLPSVGGPPLCAVDDFEYPAERAVLQAGECLVLFTDGVPEAQNDDGELYSMTRVAAALGAAPATGPAQVIAHLMADVQRFTDGAEPADDIAILVVCYEPSGPLTPAG